MSGLRWTVTTTEVLCLPNAARTVLQIMTPSSHHRILGLEYGVYFDSTSVQAQAAQVDLRRQTTIGTMTGLSLVKEDNSLAETIQSSAAFNATSEPTSGDLIKGIEVHPQTGYEYAWALGRELPIRGGERIGIIVTAVDTLNARAFFRADE